MQLLWNVDMRGNGTGACVTEDTMQLPNSFAVWELGNSELFEGYNCSCHITTYFLQHHGLSLCSNSDLCPVCLAAQGFLFGSLLAQRLGVGFVLVRKMGKLPGPTLSVAHNLEYGEAEVKIQEDAVAPEQKVLINDLLATGGTLYAACELMKKQNAEVMGCMVVIELSGVEKLKPNTLFSLVQY
uniref:adenine phosphoribosyltransferase n=1 Tax=Oncorhynchus mykiss TaxID=8022 RepID=A0A8C7QZT6_ONCMY